MVCPTVILLNILSYLVGFVSGTNPQNVVTALLMHPSPAFAFCSHVDSFADVDLDYLTSIHELETSSSHDMLSFPSKAPALASHRQSVLPSEISQLNA